MAANKPSVPSGMRDFSPEQVIRRNYILSTIENVFRKYGFMPLQTPSMENIETLTGKYGDEGDQLIYKVLNSRLHEAKDDKKVLMRNDFEQMLVANSNSKNLVEKAMRYDLTVPFARYVVMHRNEITFPFKRYQMQPVWRADRPQKGRFREFWQCDADVVGSDSLLNEVDLISIYTEVFELLKVEVEVKVNNRKILYGLSEYIGETGKQVELTVAVDKLDKVGVDGVLKELSEKGFGEGALAKVKMLLQDKITLENLKPLLKDSVSGMKGIAEMEEIFSTLQAVSPNLKPVFDVTLARGLNYYTGAIIEVVTKEVQIGSIGGGGRYDDLTGIFGLPGVSGVGISFGLDRIYEVIEELNRFPESSNNFTKLLICCMEEGSLNYAMQLAKQCRTENISTEVYPSASKLKKQLDYANAKKINYAIIIGEEEMKTKQLTLKDLNSGEQWKLSAAEVIGRIA
jgi:histidyl-tRNA synthetase